MDWPETFYSDCSIGWYLQLLCLLRSTININDNMVSCTHNIIGRSGNIHSRFKSQHTLVENVTTKNMLTINHRTHTVRQIDIRPFRNILNLSRCTHSKGVSRRIKRIALSVNHHRAIASTKTAIPSNRTRTCARSRLWGNLPSINLLPHTLQLFHVNTALHQFNRNLRLGGSCFHLPLDVLQHLSVTHALRMCQHRTEQEQHSQNKFIHNRF